jgi:hypothetical protein
MALDDQGLRKPDYVRILDDVIMLTYSMDYVSGPRKPVDRIHSSYDGGRHEWWRLAVSKSASTHVCILNGRTCIHCAITCYNTPLQ